MDLRIKPGESAEIPCLRYTDTLELTEYGYRVRVPDGCHAVPVGPTWRRYLSEHRVFVRGRCGNRCWTCGHARLCECEVKNG